MIAQPNNAETVADDINSRLTAFKTEYKLIEGVVSITDLKNWRETLMDSPDAGVEDGELTPVAEVAEEIGQAVEVAQTGDNDASDAVSAKQMWSWVQELEV